MNTIMRTSDQDRSAPWAGQGASRRRRVLGVVGAASGGGVLLLTVMLFGHASRDDWLAPTEANLAAVERCELQAGRSTTRQACVQALVHAARSPASPPRVAATELSLCAGRPGGLTQEACARQTDG